jgi:hypothetical protein
MARIPRGAVASILENEATKNTIFFEDFTGVPFVGAVAEEDYLDGAKWISCALEVVLGFGFSRP